MSQAEEIRQFLLKQVVSHPHDLVVVTASHFSVSRTTVLRHIQTLVNSGVLLKSGTTKQTIYGLGGALSQSFIFPLEASFDEFDVFRNHVAPVIKQHINQACFDICEYTLTEILNNAKDHSRGKTVKLTFNIDKDTVSFSCVDNGIGVFANLQEGLGIADPRDAMLQLGKGKLTTDTVNHTGEGLFFSARAVDEFTLMANGFSFLRNNHVEDWSFCKSQAEPGTRVDLIISRQAVRSMKDLFVLYQDDDTLQFSKTDVYVELAKEHGQRLISRSQAKRVVLNLDRFDAVTFDFKGIEMVGQGFVDQLFRVFQQQHPSIVINYVNASDDVDFMIRRGLN
jgi:hypothetical protein